MVLTPSLWYMVAVEEQAHPYMQCMEGKLQCTLLVAGSVLTSLGGNSVR